MSADSFTDEWLAAWIDAAAGAEPIVGGFAGDLTWVILKAPGGDRRIRLTLADGHPTAAQPIAAADLADDDLTITTPYRDAVAIAAGRLDANAAFMRGDLKTTGPTGPLLSWLATTQDPIFRRVLDEVGGDA